MTTADEYTNKPGLRMSYTDEKKIIDKFICKFRAHDPKYKETKPSWTYFCMGTKVAPEFLLEVPAKSHENLLVFFEFQKEIFKAPSEEIYRYLINREPWEDYDLYIFPESIEWCCVFTHELMNGISSFVVGETNSDPNKHIEDTDKD